MPAAITTVATSKTATPHPKRMCTWTGPVPFAGATRVCCARAAHDDATKPQQASYRTDTLRGDTGGNAHQANSGKVCHLPCLLIDVKFSCRYSRWL